MFVLATMVAEAVKVVKAIGTVDEFRLIEAVGNDDEDECRNPAAEHVDSVVSADVNG